MTTKGPSMYVIAEKLDTVSSAVTAIDDTVTAIRDKQLANDVHMKTIVGPPSLEDRMRSHAEEKDQLNHATGQQALMQVQAVLQLEQQVAKLSLESQIKAVDVRASNTEVERRANHEDNGKRLNKIERTMYLLLGALGALQFVLKFIFK